MLVPSDILIEKICNKMINDYEIEKSMWKISHCPKYENYCYHFTQLDMIDEVYVDVLLTSQKNPDGIYTTECGIHAHNVQVKCDSSLWKSKNWSNKDMKVTIKNCLDDFYAKVQNFELDKYTGEFYVNSEFVNEELPDLYKSGKECSVCLTKTKTRLHCNHNLCIGCWSKMANKCRCEKSNFNCPLCRLPAHYYSDDEESDEEEEVVEEGSEEGESDEV
jgi:hypothetical protein